INDRLPSFLIKNTIPFLVFFLFWLIRLQFIDGFAINPNTKEIFMKPHKYLHNFLEMPILTVILLIGIALVLTGIALNLFKKSTKGIWFSGAGTILTVWALLLSVGYNNTAYYPSTFNIQNSLTIENSSSTEFTLSLMGYVSLLVPFVMGYVYVVWKKIDSKPITKEEINSHSGGHIY
nr:cytochrome d ubiquinol oxidase subunit II [Flavobacteriaceae bacterium]